VHEVRECARDVALARWPWIGGLLIEVLDTNPGWQMALAREVDRGGTDLRPAGRLEIPGSEARLFWLPLRRAAA
jgi:hypothetical protein